MPNKIGLKDYGEEFDYSSNLQLQKKQKTPKQYYKWLEKIIFGKTYLLSGRQQQWFEAGFLNDPSVVGFEETEDCHKDKTICILAPGPSLKQIDPEQFKNTLSIAVNSAFFYYNAQYWIIAEDEYAEWLFQNNAASLNAIAPDILARQNVIMTPRAAARYWHFCSTNSRGHIFNKIYLSCLEEIGAAPFPCEGTTIVNALGMALWMGCVETFVFGMDLCKSGGVYVDGVPYSEEGAKRSYKLQRNVLRQLEYPGMTIYNVTPYSNEFGLPFTPTDKEKAMEKLK